jgi:sulfopyruvate decarboxylase TPP-binding subunit
MKLAFLPSWNRDDQVSVSKQEEGMSGKAAKVTITEKHQAILERIKKSSRTTMQRLVQRATLILMAFAGAHNEQIAREVGLGKKTGRPVAKALAGILSSPRRD